MDGLRKWAIRSLQSFRCALIQGWTSMQVIYSNAALLQVNAQCPPQNHNALFDEIAQQMQTNAYVRDNPERHDTEAKYFSLTIQDPRWPMVIARAYVSAMKKTGIIRKTYVATQVMVIGFQ